MKWLAFLLLLLPVNLWAAVSFDTSNTSTSAGGVTSFTSSITVGGGCANPALIGKVKWKGGVTSTSASASAGSMTLGGTTTQVYNTQYQVALYSRPGPTGAQTVTWSFSGVIDVGAGILESYCGANQSVPVGTTVTVNGTYSTGNPTVNITVATGGMATDIVTLSNDPTTITPDAGQTATYNNSDASLAVTGTSYKTCSGTCSMSWTSSTGDSDWGQVATPIAPVTASVVARRRAIIVQ